MSHRNQEQGRTTEFKSSVQGVITLTCPATNFAKELSECRRYVCRIRQISSSSTRFDWKHRRSIIAHDFVQPLKHEKLSCGKRGSGDNMTRTNRYFRKNCNSALASSYVRTAQLSIALADCLNVAQYGTTARKQSNSSLRKRTRKRAIKERPRFLSRGLWVWNYLTMWLSIRFFRDLSIGSIDWLLLD